MNLVQAATHKKKIIVKNWCKKVVQFLCLFVCFFVITAAKSLTHFCYPFVGGLKLCSHSQCDIHKREMTMEEIDLHTHARISFIADKTKKCQLASLKQLCSYCCCFSSPHNQFLTVEFKIKDFLYVVLSRSVRWTGVFSRQIMVIITIQLLLLSFVDFDDEKSIFEETRQLLTVFKLDEKFKKILKCF